MNQPRNEPLLISVRVSCDISDMLQRDLVDALPGERQLRNSALPEWTEWLMLVTSTTGATAFSVTTDVAGKIKSWRKRCRDNGTEPQARIKAETEPEIDLSTATDEEIAAWVRKVYGEKDNEIED